MEINSELRILDLKENVLVEANAIFVLNKNMIKGKLILTNRRLIHIRKSGKYKILDLTLIESVYKYKFWGLILRGFYFEYNSSTIKILVDYPYDWINLIESQIK